MYISAAFVRVLALFLASGVFQSTYAEQPSAGISQSPTKQSKTTETDTRKVQKLLDKTTASTEALDSLREDIAKLSANLQKAKDEDLVVLPDQRRRKYAELRDELEKLVNNIIELEAAGRATREARKMAAAAAGQVSDWLKAEINDSLKLLASLDEKIKTAAQSDVPELRQQVPNERKAVDKGLAALVENSDLMERLGLDSKSDLNYLDETLVQRAESTAARLQYVIEQRNGLRKQTIDAGEDDKKLLKEKLVALNGGVSATAENLKITIDLMSERKLDTTEYKKIVISSTGEITKEIFETEVALGLLQEWLDSGKEWLIDNGPRWAFKLVVFVLILMVFNLLASTVKGIVSRPLASSRVHASKLLQDCSYRLRERRLSGRHPHCPGTTRYQDWSSACGAGYHRIHRRLRAAGNFVQLCGRRNDSDLPALRCRGCR